MRVTALIENTALSHEFVCEHGLSLLLETADGVILFDAGKSNSFLLNAKRLNIDLRKVDLAILSHGHYDHSGGMEEFLKLNAHAPLYLRETALDTHLSLKPGGISSISVDISPKLLTTERIHFTSGKEQIGENLLLFTSSIGKGSSADANQTLYILRGPEHGRTGRTADGYGHRRIPSFQSFAGNDSAGLVFTQNRFRPA